MSDMGPHTKSSLSFYVKYTIFDIGRKWIILSKNGFFIMMNEKTWQNAMVIYANWTTRLRPSDAFTYTQVQSRFLVWGESGKGVLKINDVPIRMSPGKVIFTPWNHTIDWIADSREPFQAGAIHIIPDMPREDPPRYSPFHAAAPEFPEFFNRHDEEIEGFEDTATFDVPLDHPLLQLGRYVIDRFSAECPEFMLRTFPRQLLYELYMLRAGEKGCYPEPVRNMLNIIEHYLEDRIDTKMLKRVSSLSLPTIHRMFRRFFGCTPREYIARRRMERAAELLRGTSLPVRVIARRLQYDDPFYFSRRFKAHFELSPRQWRNSAHPEPVLRPRREPSSLQDIPGKKHWFYLPHNEDE